MDSPAFNNSYDRELAFTFSMLDNMSIPHRIINDDFDLKNDTGFILGLHRIFYSTEQMKAYLHHSMADYALNTIYRIRNELLCSYFSFLLPEAAGSSSRELVLIGPFLTESISNDEIYGLLDRLNASKDLYQAVRDYIDNVTMLDSDVPLVVLLNTLGEKMWGSMESFSMTDVANHTSDAILEAALRQSSSTADFISHDSPDIESSFRKMNALSERYLQENELMDAVSKGELHKAEMFFSSFKSLQRLELRVPDPVRNLKNYTIVMNTLLRKAAEHGNVHPIHLDQTSSKLAARIEQCRSESDVHALMPDMVRKYCLLVKNHSLSSYSPLIQHALMIIDTDISADLSLRFLAEQLHVNASYFSAQFKRELGSTLTEYVTQKRVNQSIFLLNSSDLQISNIARQCGIPDVHYFSKLFKKQVGMSPSEYREMLYSS